MADFISYNHDRFSEVQMRTRIDDMLENMQNRRSVREFSSEPVPLDVVRKCIEIAGAEPSGAHKQPWTFFLVTASEIRREIRKAAEKEEYTNYYVNESVGIAVGMLLTALHEVGLAVLTHTLSPMNFLEKILERPNYERAYLNIPFCFPASDCEVPNISRKPLDEILKKY